MCVCVCMCVCAIQIGEIHTCREVMSYRMHNSTQMIYGLSSGRIGMLGTDNRTLCV